jgi:MFS transporter, DHA3 family, macrolide efflux protein
MRTFIIVWLGQLVSTFGSTMTWFGLKIWAWDLTEQATALTLVSFFSLLPSIVITPFAGVIVDRWNRKWLMMIGDAIAILATLMILLLYLTQQLQVWHLYVTGLFTGAFEEIQTIAYTASISLLVPKRQYVRASSLNATLHYGSIILAPALAGFLFYIIGLQGILLIDGITFMIAIATVLSVTIPQPQVTTTHQPTQGIMRQITFGWRYLWQRPGLRAIVMLTLLFTFAHDLGGTLFSPMILARSGSDARVLGSISAIAGIGGVTGAILLAVWGGPKRRIHGFLIGMIGAGLSKMMFGMGQTLLVWLPAQFCSSINFPLKRSAEEAILLSKIAPDIQGRVFATRSMLIQILSAIATLIAGPLADSVFEPAMMPDGQLAPILGPIIGTGTGAGMAVIYVLTALGLLLTGMSGYTIPSLRHIEKTVPDSDDGSTPIPPS